jgi:hypothetical protein
MPDVLAPFVVPVVGRAFELALYALFVAVPTVITREPVARRIRAWTPPRAVLAYAALVVLSMLMLWFSGARPSDTVALARARFLVFWLGLYVAEALLFVRYVRTEHAPGFVRARRREGER